MDYTAGIYHEFTSGISIALLVLPALTLNGRGAHNNAMPEKYSRKITTEFSMYVQNIPPNHIPLNCMINNNPLTILLKRSITTYIRYYLQTIKSICESEQNLDQLQIFFFKNFDPLHRKVLLSSI